MLNVSRSPASSSVPVTVVTADVFSGTTKSVSSVRLQLPKLPWLSTSSSTTHTVHVPFGSAPLNADANVAVPSESGWLTGLGRGVRFQNVHGSGIDPGPPYG